jgi:hypothetical protein
LFVPDLVFGSRSCRRSTVGKCRRVPVLVFGEILREIGSTAPFSHVERPDHWKPITDIETVAGNRDDFVIPACHERVSFRCSDLPAGFEFEPEEFLGCVVTTHLFDWLPLDLLVGTERRNFQLPGYACDFVITDLSAL